MDKVEVTYKCGCKAIVPMGSLWEDDPRQTAPVTLCPKCYDEKYWVGDGERVRITGNTYEHRDMLRASGLSWDPAGKAWSGAAKEGFYVRPYFNLNLERLDAPPAATESSSQSEASALADLDDAESRYYDLLRRYRAGQLSEVDLEDAEDVGFWERRRKVEDAKEALRKVNPKHPRLKVELESFHADGGRAFRPSPEDLVDL